MLEKFTQQINTHFLEILDPDRNKAAAKIDIENIAEQLNRSELNSQIMLNTLKGLHEIGEKSTTARMQEVTQSRVPEPGGNMMACALPDYVDEISEMIGPRPVTITILKGSCPFSC